MHAFKTMNAEPTHIQFLVNVSEVQPTTGVFLDVLSR